jgi:3-methylfumaryl-CoA hydratase
MNDAIDDYTSWIGRTETVSDVIDLSTAQAVAAMFDLEPDALDRGELPPLWHWFYFLAKAPQSQLGVDGHPRRDTATLMPPIPLPRRMFAGARLAWHRPLLIGRPARRESAIEKIEMKEGQSGALAFVTVQNRYFQRPAAETTGMDSAAASSEHEQLCVEERQSIVYREPGPPIAPPEPAQPSPPPAGAWVRTVVPDTRLLFRFSALTFNAHRIHYDRPYAVQEEGYPGLVVHGPLTAMLLLHLASEHTAGGLKSFQFRSQAPLFDLLPFQLIGARCENRIDLQAIGPDGKVAMVAAAENA